MSHNCLCRTLRPPPPHSVYLSHPMTCVNRGLLTLLLMSGTHCCSSALLQPTARTPSLPS